MAGKPGRRRRAHEEHEEHPDERWLVTYADMVTLLMVLFIIMFAMSTVDTKKYQELKNGLADGFGRSVTILNGADPMRDDTGATNPERASYDRLIEELPAVQQAEVTKILEETDRLRSQRQYAEAKNEADRLLQVWRRIDEALKAQGLQDDVRASIDERGLVVSLVSEHVVFEPNMADLTERGRRVVDTIAPILAELPEPVGVDGHTNQVPVKPKYYPTDWDLSSARAVNVLRRLNEVHRIPDRRLTASAFGHTKPLVDPARPGSQRVNKRVDIVVLSQAPASTRAKFAELQEHIQHGLGAPGTPPAEAPAPPPDPAAGSAGTETHAQPATGSDPSAPPVALPAGGTR